jgi:serine/threonine-protein kinase ULK/ATG1
MDRPVAIKVQFVPRLFSNTNESNQNLEAIIGDIVALKFLKHPHIVRLFDVKRRNNQIFMIMEYCNQKDLQEFMKDRPFSE